MSAEILLLSVNPPDVSRIHSCFYINNIVLNKSFSRITPEGSELFCP